MSSLSKLKELWEKFVDALKDVWDKIKDSPAYQQVKAKYDDLDRQQKVYVQLGAAAAVVGCVTMTVLWGLARVNGLKYEINDREELIGYLQRSADSIQQLKAQAAQIKGGDLNSPLPSFLTNVMNTSGIDPKKADVGSEKNGFEDKDVQEILVEMKLTQINLRQLTRFLFQLVDQGSGRSLNIKNLDINTRNETTGWLDATVMVSAFKAK